MKANQFAVLIMAAGKGQRMGGDVPKQFQLLDGIPVLMRTIDVFVQLEQVREIVVVTGEAEVEACIQLIEPLKHRCRIQVVAGGADRQASVRAGLQQISGEWVAIHDGVRPFVREQDILACWQAAQQTGAAILAVPMKETIKQVSEGFVTRTLPREQLWNVQTPQLFRTAEISAAHEQAAEEKFIATDDAMLAEHQGLKVAVVQGTYHNLKLTTSEDWIWAEQLLARDKLQEREQDINQEREQDMMRIGQGFDVHAFADGRRLMLGGIEIPHERGLAGHSDADVLLHAISDAILGAIGEGDIGRHFPDTDAAFLDADSGKLLQTVWRMAVERQLQIGNVDATVMAQRPKLAPYMQEIQLRIAQLLDCEPSRINIKATTTERLGFVGREEGIAAQAVVCLTGNML